MLIQTTRFGQVEILEDSILKFSEGILGFSDLRRFVLLDDPTDDIFAWLQSCDEPAIAFPVLEPELFAESYKISLAKTDYEALKMSDLQRARLLCIVTIPEDPTQMTANLKAPIVINMIDKSARQCVLQDNNLAIREPIFSKLQQRVVQDPSRSIKSQVQAFEVAVKIPSRLPEQGL